MTSTSRYLPLPLLALALCSFQIASAQTSSFDVNVGLGSSQDSAAAGLDTSNGLACSSSTTAGNCSKTPALSGFMMGFGANLMLWKHFGVGGNVFFQPGKQTYATITTANPSQGIPAENIQSRLTMYSVDGIYQPVSTKKASLQLAGGIGAARVSFYDQVTSSGGLLGNSNSSQLYNSTTHFQVHGGVGVQIYVTDKVFIRPQFDIHYVPNLVQFGRNLVTSEAVWIGYSFGKN